MSREHLILSCFIILVVAVFVIVVKNGIHTRRRLCGGVSALILLSVMAIGLHCYRSDIASVDFTNTTLSLPEIGLGVVLLGLACVGCMCASDQRE